MEVIQRGAAVIRFTYSQHGCGQQPPGEELQEDHHNCMGDFGSAPAVLPIQEGLLDIHGWKGASILAEAQMDSCSDNTNTSQDRVQTN